MLSLLSLMLLGALLGISALLVFILRVPSWHSSREIPKNIDYQSVDVVPRLGSPANDNILVVGGSGFLASHVVSLLLLRGEKHIHLFDISPSKKFASDPRIKFIQGDITNPADVSRACANMDTVYHTAAYIAFFQRLPFQYAKSYNINVNGTQNVIDACLEHGVSRLIFTSTSNVVVDPATSRADMDETEPYCQHPTSHYTSTKMLAEKAILAANGKRGPSGTVLQTVSLRPCSLIFGAGDRFIVDSALSSGVCRMMFPDRIADYVYVENVAYAHLLAADQLRTSAAGVAGEVFSITNNMAPMTDAEFAAAMQHAMPSLKVQVAPIRLIRILAWISECVQRLGKGRWSLGQLDLVTPATLGLSCLTYTFTDTKSRRVLGYSPLYSVDEGLQKAFAMMKKQA